MYERDRFGARRRADEPAGTTRRRGFFERALDRLRGRREMPAWEREELEAELRDIPAGVQARYALAGDLASAGGVMNRNFGTGLGTGWNTWADDDTPRRAALIRTIDREAGHVATERDTIPDFSGQGGRDEFDLDSYPRARDYRRRDE